MPYDFLIDTDETERVKVVSVWSESTDEDLRCARTRAIMGPRPIRSASRKTTRRRYLEQRSRPFRLHQPLSF